MKLNLYSVKDILNGFTPPVVMPNHETALRWFQDMLEENITMKCNPNDFTLHFIGQLDTNNGNIYEVDEKYLKKDLNNFKGDKENE